MRFDKFRRLTLPSALAAATALLTAQAAMAAPGQADTRLIRSPQGDALQVTAPIGAQQRVSAAAGHPFATTEARAAVRPLQWTEDAGPAKGQNAQANRARPLPPAQSTGAGMAPDFANYMARRDFADVWRAIDAEGEKVAPALPGEGGFDDGLIRPMDGAHYSYVRFLGNYYTSQWQLPPWNKIGKLYFNTPSGASSYCTASVVSGTSVIVTAAHCVYTRGAGFNTNFVFVPADRYGAAPYGRYGWQSATVLNDWINIGGRAHDVATIRLAGEATSGQPVVNYVGWLGRSWNYGYEQYTYSHGYASNLSTQYTNVCAGTTYSAPSEGADVLVQGCDMTYGSSGGPWIINFAHNSHAGNHVNSVVSGPHIGAFGTAYVGARFTSNNIVPLCNASGC